MGERKGQNKYYPPDFDPAVHGSLNGYHGVHALRERARKLDQGILIIRFEAPWGFWCGGCHNHVERGVRYNAEKKKVGNYYTTPVFAFTMKCHLCDNRFTFETDPKACDYKITQGARRKVETWDPSDAEVLELPDDAEKAKRVLDAMYRLEHEAADKHAAAQAKPVMQQLLDLKERTTGRDYDTNSLLRAGMRREKKRVEALRRADDAFRQRTGVRIDLVPEAPEDVAHAKAQAFGSSSSSAAAGAAPAGREVARRVKRLVKQESIFAPGAAVRTRLDRALQAGSSPQERAKSTLLAKARQQQARQAGATRLDASALVAPKRAKSAEAAASRPVLVAADYGSDDTSA
jgi:coiled-coil domain-containing protein 130